MSNVAGLRHQCPTCKRPRSYSYAWDAFYCENCNKWLEEVCEDSTCIFCLKRKETPKAQGLLDHKKK